jgi:formate dehydrogenase subunit gamma
MTVDSASVEERVREIIDAHRRDRGALLPILHALLAEFGYVDQAVLPLVAKELNLSRADVHGVVTFYDDFRQEPPGYTTVRICRAEACQAVGAEAVVARAQELFGVKVGATAADGSLTLKQVFCLGNCALGPSAEVNGRIYGRVDANLLRAIVAAVEETGQP